MKNIIEVKNLNKTYKYYKKQTGIVGSFKNLFNRETLIKEAVKNISFDIKEGEFVGFIGPNGAGKTTTLKVLSGILYPTSGEVTALGYVPWERKKEYQKQFGIVMGQKNQLWWDLPPMETFVLNKEIYEIPDEQFKETLEELTELLEVRDILNVQTRRLSLGQRMKCELMVALLHRPRILFLDEPTIGLDVNSQRKIRDFLKEYNKKSKTTIILTSHYMHDIQKLCERVIVIDLGKIMFDGPMKKLTEEFEQNKRIELELEENNININDFKKLGRIVEHDKDKVILEVPKSKVAEVSGKILEKYKVEDLLISEVDIEEIISDIFTKNAQKRKK